MPDSTDSAIGELPQAEYIDDSDRIPLEQGGVAKYVLGALLKEFINRNILDIRALTLPVGSDVTASYNAETGVLTLGIPRSLGAANSVDGVAAGTSGDVPLGAVSYDRGQSLTAAQKTRAKANSGIKEIVTEDLTFSSDRFDAGTIGTRALQLSAPDPHPDLQLIGIAITYIGNSGEYLPLIFKNSGTIYCNFYRCTSSAVGNPSAHARLTYLNTQS